ncbi:hypothetical protein AAFC00_002710 [Neodothiora populina]|uniref:DNA repair protein RAD16 n=1 Tax=Neodothiora populina TaxID=2781224 RepID=A0ABR3P805_9PEZI
MPRTTRASLRHSMVSTPAESDVETPQTRQVSRPLSSREKSSARASISADSDQIMDEAIRISPYHPRTEVQVVIPAMSAPTKPTAARAGSSKSTTSDSSRSESVDLTGVDTPGTSIAVTPDVSVDGRRYGAKGKRSRLSIEETAQQDELMDDADAALAIRLQQQEYEDYDQVEEDDEPSRKRVKLGSSRASAQQRVDMEDDDESDLSSVASFMPDEEDLKIFKRPALPAAARGKGKGKARSIVPDGGDVEDDVEEDYQSGLAAARAGKKAIRAPIRQAGAAARKSIENVLEAGIPDSDDDDISDFTDMASEDAFESDDASSIADANAPTYDDDDDDVPLAQTRKSNIGGSAMNGIAPSRRSKGKSKRKGQHNLANTTFEEEYALVSGEYGNSLTGRKLKERKKLEKAHPQIKTMWDDLGQIPVITPQQAAQPTSINRKLKSFQLEGLDWMTRMEKTHYKGGLLGDEMGMGKTIQAVSLIMSDYPQKQPTLVLVPPVALMQWASEIKEYTDGTLKVLVYHGQNSKVKSMSRKELMSYDVIMISYNSLESLYRKEVKGWTRGDNIIKETSSIHSIHFHRLILDEAHSIKTRTTGVAKACFALKGTYKWCLSGTPVQNRIGEFFSLLRFLEVRPFADYFCKKCPCSILHWELNEEHKCNACKHAGMEHVSVFNQELLNPLTQSEDKKIREKAMDKLHMITERIMLRRMKRDYTSSMELPPKEVIVHNEFFGETERDFSSSIMSNTTRTFDTYVSRGVMLNNYANIFGLIMQMRQVANHPDLLLKKHAAEGQNVLVCNICDEAAEDAVRSKCKHDFCRMCVRNFVSQIEASGGEADCPRCHIPLSIDFDQPEIEQDEESVKKSSIINRIKMENWTSSTKVEMLVYDLYKLRSKKQTLKSIVFSQFTSMLQLIEWRLRRAGFNTVMLDGSMTPIQRQRSIEYFMTNSDVEVFLVSLKAGGVALNLTEASRVFIVDPWWNPAAEWQSADRCHRIGQKRPCVITRLCIEDSVESRMVMLQEKKANMINGTINNDKVAMEKLTPEDMQFLFRGS